MKRAAFTLAVFFTVFGALFLAGETIDDPGGWAAVGLIAAWAVPVVALGLLAWRRPDLAVRIFAGLTAGVVVMSVWFAVDADAWQSVEQGNGPVRAVVSFAVAAALVPLGLHRPRITGALLLVVGLVPPILAGVGSRHGSSSLVAASLMPVVVGALYLLAAVPASPPPVAGADAPLERPRQPV